MTLHISTDFLFWLWALVILAVVFLQWRVLTQLTRDQVETRKLIYNETQRTQADINRLKVLVDVGQADTAKALTQLIEKLDFLRDRTNSDFGEVVQQVRKTNDFIVKAYGPESAIVNKLRRQIDAEETQAAYEVDPDSMLPSVRRAYLDEMSKA